VKSTNEAIGAALSCRLVKQLISGWAGTKDRPFPYLEVGDHLTTCLNCLAWSTEIAYRPADRYVRALRLRLSEVLGYLGASLLAAWSQNQEVKIRFSVEPESLHQAQNKALKLLRRYGGFSSETRAEAERIREMIPHVHRSSLCLPAPRSASIAHRSSPLLATLEPYELVRYFFQTAIRIAPLADNHLSRLVNLGIAENYRALSEQRAGGELAHREARADAHFQKAREYLEQVIATGDQRKALLPSPADQDALISARITLAGTEVQQGRYSEPALHKAINLLYAARRLVTGFGLDEANYPEIFDNLLISYLRLFQEHGIQSALAQAQELAQEICALPLLARVFLQEYVMDNADIELTQLLSAPSAERLLFYLKQQARQVCR
jgi:hypothetical protein